MPTGPLLIAIIDRMPEHPILYSFRRCPYAIRARMALAYAGTSVELREVLLRDKPEAMLRASAKGTVPVLVLPDDTVIDESLDVMHWALQQHDPQDWLSSATSDEVRALIAENDGPFKHWLDRYKYADRYPDHPAGWYRDQALPFLVLIDSWLQEWQWLGGDSMGFGDVALFPFLRQFASVDRPWFDEAAPKGLREWLRTMLESRLFLGVMDKYPVWRSGRPPLILTLDRY